MNLNLYLFILLFLALTSNCGKNKKDLFIQNEDIKSSVTIYKLKENKWIFSDKDDALTATLPASTFKIVNSLIFLEEEIIKPGQIIKWDKKIRKFNGKTIDSWNKDSDIQDAFKNSTIWFYIKLSKLVSKKKYKYYLNLFNYGNFNLDNYGSDFWNQGNFFVTPVNQIELLIKIYNKTIPIKKEHINYLKQIMINEVTSDFSLYGKTGWTIKDENNIGWYVGFIETKNNTCFFATRLIDHNNKTTADFGSLRKSITMKALSNENCIK
jgi:beta-lactamase class D